MLIDVCFVLQGEHCYSDEKPLGLDVYGTGVSAQCKLIAGGVGIYCSADSQTCVPSTKVAPTQTVRTFLSHIDRF